MLSIGITPSPSGSSVRSMSPVQPEPAPAWRMRFAACQSVRLTPPATATGASIEETKTPDSVSGARTAAGGAGVGVNGSPVAGGALSADVGGPCDSERADPDVSLHDATKQTAINPAVHARALRCQDIACSPLVVCRYWFTTTTAADHASERSAPVFWPPNSKSARTSNTLCTKHREWSPSNCRSSSEAIFGNRSPIPPANADS